MVQLLAFRPREGVLIDFASIAGLSRRLGPRGAEGFIGARVEEISDRLANIDWLLRHGDGAEVQADARRVADLSDEIGLESLARAARDLAAVAARGDSAAQAAVWARVVRIGDRSLALVWEVPGLSV